MMIIYLSIYPSIYLSIYSSFYLFIYLIYLYIFSIYPVFSIFLSIYYIFYLFIYIPTGCPITIVRSTEIEMNPSDKDYWSSRIYQISSQSNLLITLHLSIYLPFYFLAPKSVEQCSQLNTAYSIIN